MSNVLNHTMTPWRTEHWSRHAATTVLVDDASVLTGKRVVAECEREEDAAFIVQACNSHDQLVAAAKTAAAVFASQKWLDTSGDPEAVALRQLRAALAAAGAA